MRIFRYDYQYYNQFFKKKGFKYYFSVIHDYRMANADLQY